LRRPDELNLPFQPARERHGVEVGHRPDAERGQRVFQFALALHVRAALLALQTVREIVGGLDRREA
jgi:hypothetical protein